MLCRFGQLRNSSVFTQLIHFSSAPTSRATSEDGTVPERIVQNEEPISKIEEVTMNTPGYGPKTIEMNCNKII